MEIKRLPEDFQVEELTDVRPSEGDFALYRLSKRWIGTPEAVESVLAAWSLPRHRLSYGGMKDFHAVTQQYLTIRRGPKRDFHSQRFRMEYLGQAPAAFSSSDIRANRFTIVVRDVTEAEAAKLAAAAEQTSREGTPNYFDDQRFGSVGESGEFVALPWIQGDYERALWLAMADPNEHDTPAEKKQKRLLQTHWRRWEECRKLLKRSPRRELVAGLAERPDNFRGAFSRLRADMRRLYLAAFQSHLWNRVLATFLYRQCRAEQLCLAPSRFGPLPFPRNLDSEQIAALHAAALPLPSSRTELQNESQRQLVAEVLGQFGLTLDQLRVKHPRDSFFSRGQRQAMIAAPIAIETTQPDDVYPGRRKLTLRFELPRGAYATMVMKRLTAEARV